MSEVGAKVVENLIAERDAFKIKLECLETAIADWYRKDRMEQYPEEVTPRQSVKWIEERAAELSASRKGEADG